MKGITKSLSRIGSVVVLGSASVTLLAYSFGAVDSTAAQLVPYLAPIALTSLLGYGAVKFIKKQKPLLVEGLRYDKDNGLMELIIRNTGANKVFFTTSLNLAQSIKNADHTLNSNTLEYVLEEQDMMPARAENIRRNFSLLAWDDDPRECFPNQTATITYPMNQREFRLDDCVRVNLVYGANQDFLDQRASANRRIEEKNETKKYGLVNENVVMDLAEYELIERSIEKASSLTIDEVIKGFELEEQTTENQFQPTYIGRPLRGNSQIQLNPVNISFTFPSEVLFVSSRFEGVEN
ncbi:MAG: hypothetical protein ABH950_08585 [Candidatus Altiarchaeota archaeon]